MAHITMIHDLTFIVGISAIHMEKKDRQSFFLFLKATERYHFRLQIYLRFQFPFWFFFQIFSVWLLFYFIFFYILSEESLLVTLQCISLFAMSSSYIVSLECLVQNLAIIVDSNYYEKPERASYKNHQAGINCQIINVKTMQLKCILSLCVLD